MYSLTAKFLEIYHDLDYYFVYDVEDTWAIWDTFLIWHSGEDDNRTSIKIWLGMWVPHMTENLIIVKCAVLMSIFGDTCQYKTTMLS